MHHRLNTFEHTHIPAEFEAARIQALDDLHGARKSFDPAILPIMQLYCELIVMVFLIKHWRFRGCDVGEDATERQPDFSMFLGILRR